MKAKNKTHHDRGTDHEHISKKQYDACIEEDCVYVCVCVVVVVDLTLYITESYNSNKQKIHNLILFIQYLYMTIYLYSVYTSDLPIICCFLSHFFPYDRTILICNHE